MRETQFTNGEYYHVFNRGNNKRIIFSDDYDLARFFQSMYCFNSLDPIGSIFENSFRKDLLGVLGGSTSKSSKLVDFVCYCLNPNHYHFILKQLSDDGVKKFMHRVGTGYTMYYNRKHNSTGSLFQGRFKVVHIDRTSAL